MSFIKKSLKFWQKIRKNWKIKYRLIIRNDSTHHDSFSLRLSPKNIFVVVTTSAIILIVLTAMLIAFTPLRVYVPGYTNPDEYRKYRAAAKRVDSLELVFSQNKQYINNFYRILNEEVMPNELEQVVPENGTMTQSETELTAQHSEKEMDVRKEADKIQSRTSGTKQNTQTVSINKKADIENLFLLAPTSGTIIGYYSVAQNQYGIDIKNVPNTLINSVADGIVVFAGYDANDGNVIIIQHHNNVLSVYKHNHLILKSKGAQVKAGEPIAEMGKSGITDKGIHLHFELWHDGFPLNPLDYIYLK